MTRIYNITIKDFCIKYSLVHNAIYAGVNRGDYINSTQKLGKEATKVNEAFFIKRKKFQNKIVQENIETYYIVKEVMNDTNLAKYLETKTNINYVLWRSWLGQGMWMNIPESILSFKVSNYHWLFNKYMRFK